jgi:histidine phosphotransferase ChpT
MSDPVAGPAAALAMARAITARLCHDLSGPLAAIGCTIDELAGAEPAIAALAKESAATASARLRLVRAAWGGACPELAPGALAAWKDGLPNGARIELRDHGFPQAPLEGAKAAVVLTALMLAAEALPHGGTISLAGGPHGVTLRIEGRRAGFSPAIGAPAPAAAAAAPRGVTVSMLRLLAAEQGAALRLAAPEELAIAWG